MDFLHDPIWQSILHILLVELHFQWCVAWVTKAHLVLFSVMSVESL